VTPPFAIPLSGWADAQIAAIADITGSSAIAALTGAKLMGERAAINGFRVPGRVSAGGGCRLYDTRDGHVALNLSRPDDRTMLAALFSDAGLDVESDTEIAVRFLQWDAVSIVARGREMGLAIADLAEARGVDDSFHLPHDTDPRLRPEDGSQNGERVKSRLNVVDLSALWAGPLSGRLLGLAGAHVIKVESQSRPDALRDGDPALFALLSGNKQHACFDLRAPEGRNSLLSLIRRADIVIEAARPRALLQLGIDADQLVADVTGLVWVTITGHGGAGDAANWIGFGDDCGVAGGLSKALSQATGQIGFVGDAIADPLTGIAAARLALEQRRRGTGARLMLSMSGIVATALRAEQARDPGALDQSLKQWATARGMPFPQC
jgi:CoA-transferase family III